MVDEDPSSLLSGLHTDSSSIRKREGHLSEQEPGAGRVGTDRESWGKKKKTLQSEPECPNQQGGTPQRGLRMAAAGRAGEELSQAADLIP